MGSGGDVVRVIVSGGSDVKGMEGRFCGQGRDSSLMCYLNGARVQDVSERLQDILIGYLDQAGSNLWTIHVY